MMARLMGGWISTFKHPPWRMNFRPASKYYDKTPQDIIFQHDGDPKHQSHQAKYWLKDMDSRSSHGLLKSPDLNPIEHLWSHLKRWLGGYERAQGGVLELWERVEVEWKKYLLQSVRI